jgi:flagellar protein FlbD
MIRLTHLNGKPFVANAELVKFVEETPDTVITMRDGERIVVREKADEVIERAIRYARSVRGMTVDLV